MLNVPPYSPQSIEKFYCTEQASINLLFKKKHKTEFINHFLKLQVKAFTANLSSKFASFSTVTFIIEFIAWCQGEEVGLRVPVEPTSVFPL